MSKLKMILADDEPVILNGLKWIVDWAGLGIEIVGEAQDGQQLLRLIQEKQPDLIVSDICMPGLSGIDVLREMNASDKPGKVIFISAHKEFQYAQDALKYGALDYLVKPVDTTALEQVVQKAVSIIRNESLEERNRGKLEQLERNIRAKTTEELLDRLTDGDRSVVAEIVQISGERPERSVTVCVAEWGRAALEQNRWQERERRLIDFAVTNIMGEIVRDMRGSFFFRKKEAFCCLLAIDELEQAVQAAQAIRDNVRDYLKIDLAIGVGGIVTGIGEAVVSYKQAQEALERAYFIGPGQILAYPSVQEQPVRQQVTEVQNRLLQAILAGWSDEELFPVVSELLHVVRQASAGSKHAVVSVLYSTLMRIRQELNSLGFAVESSEDSAHMLLERSAGLETLPEVEACFNEALKDIGYQLKVGLGGRELQQIRQVKDYIQKHYAENITLEKISGLIYMNSSYFSTFFKKHTGENYKQYLTEVRMKHARRLLLHSELMIYEVAEQVGYGNARLFSEMFRKHVGQTPQEFRLTKGKLAYDGEQQN
ncbi:response regulator [Paenibacillus sanguinis]|uniref:response regulator n=1 Tax=Paenibacillus sanguinis TaxID=225906 RepID=UPI00037A0427|nr:response regulator [Paenibacillus sanguinis]